MLIFGPDKNLQFFQRLLKANGRFAEMKKKTPNGFGTGNDEKKLKSGQPKTTNFLCLALHSVNREYIITIEARISTLRATQWQEQNDGESKPVAFLSRYLNDSKRRLAPRKTFSTIKDNG